MSRSPYEILHLEEDATYDEIKERYRHLTKNLHPDKQPLQNYQITKKLFEQIDEAYKSIASPLRRFLFREYGLPALRILDQLPGEFQEFDVERLTADQMVRLRQLMIYMLYQRQAGFEMDKTKFNTKSLLNISKWMKRKQLMVGNANAKRNIYFPEVENSSFDYEMVLPELYGFSNSLTVSHVGSNLRSDPKFLMAVALTAVRRLYTNYMLSAQCMISDESTMELSIDRICENNLHLKFTPVSLVGWNLGRPKFAIEKSFQHYQCSAVTDLGSTSFEFSESNQRRVSKSLKLYIESGTLGIMPKVEWQMGENLRFFVQLSTGLNFKVQSNNINIHQSLTYGYKLMLNDDLKLQLTSSIGYPNYFQLTLLNSKFRASIPFATGEPDSAKFEFLKITAMILTYLLFQGYKLRMHRNKKNWQKMLKEQENRLNDQRRELQKQVSFVEMSAHHKRDKEIRYNGLVIVRAYLGQKTKIMHFKQRVSKISFPEPNYHLNDSIIEVEERIGNLIVLGGQPRQQVCDVTLLIQNQVSGGQIINYDLEQLNKFNPAIYDSIKPHLLLIYSERGQLKTLVMENRGKLSLGGFTSHGKGLKFGVTKQWRQFVDYFMS